MNGLQSELRLALPEWAAEFAAGTGPKASVEERMRLAIELSRRNACRGGGPFGAAVFDVQSGALISVGVNLVTACNCSAAHAEVVALSLAQARLGSYDLSAAGSRRCELVSSTEPCAMCLGAVPWSGVARLVCGARDEDARAIGFDEGAKPADWIEAFARRGIVVVRDVLRAEATEVLSDYAADGGVIYSPTAADLR